MKIRAIAIAATLAFLGAAGCADLLQTAGQIAQGQSSATPQQANTLGDAELIFQSVAGAADIAVQSGKLSKAQLQQIDSLRAQLHGALVALRQAHAAGQNLDLAAFNQALAAWNRW